MNYAYPKEFKTKLRGTPAVRWGNYVNVKGSDFCLNVVGPSLHYAPNFRFHPCFSLHGFLLFVKKVGNSVFHKAFIFSISEDPPFVIPVRLL